MFTGLIETIGTILAGRGARRFETDCHCGPPSVTASGCAPATALRSAGVCLTALDIEPASNPPRFHADLAAETVARTSLSLLKAGSTVNLELPTPAGTPLGGHVVQGHVDATGTLLSLQPVDANADPSLADWWLRVAVPAQVSRYMVEKGSIAIEGISLTIARWEPATAEGNVVSVAIIPHTYARTNLHTLKPGQPVNIEADVLIKFMEQRSVEPRFELSVAYLIANGY